MIGIETLLKDLNEALNVNLADNSRRFKIIPDGGEYAGFTREKNNITEYIDGVGSITQSSITPLASGIEVSTLELSVAVAVKLEQSKGVPDEELFLPVRNAISEYASTAKTKAIDGYAVSITASWFISGPARYNTKKNEALMSRSRALYENNADRINPDDNVYLKKIKSILTNASIKSNDDAATAKLQDKYDKLKAELENGKAMNAYFRKNKTLVGFPGISEQSAKAFDRANASGDYFSRQPFMSYRLQNGNAELHRIQARIDTLNKAKAQAEAAKENPQAAAEATAAKYPKVDGVEVQENAEEMRVQLRFPGKPDEQTRSLLKSHGFRWSPTQGAWQRQLNGNGTYAARQVMNTLANKK